MEQNNIVFIGAGNMAEAIIAGLAKQPEYKERLIAMNRKNDERLAFISDQYGITCTRSIGKAFEKADVIILATKPKDAEDATKHIREHVQQHHLIISVMAGIKTDLLTSWLGKDNPVVRVMPNTSSIVGQSASSIAKGKHATNRHIALAKLLFETIGTATIVEEEELHLTTGIAGSGPAYIYRIIELMEKNAVDMGLDHESAKTLVRQTLVGAAEMLQSTGKEPGELRRQVTSPGGTTEAGLKALDDGGLSEILRETIQQAAKRSKELGEKADQTVSKG